MSLWVMEFFNTNVPCGCNQTSECVLCGWVDSKKDEKKVWRVAKGEKWSSLILVQTFWGDIFAVSNKALDVQSNS